MSDEKNKKCNECKVNKKVSDYYKRYGTCKECVKAKQRARNKRDKENYISLLNDPNERQKPKTCTKCKQIKTIGDYSQDNRYKCLDCEREHGHKNYNTIRKNWRDNNPDRLRKLQANWYQKNKPKVRERWQERYDTEPCFKLRQILRKRLLQHIQKIKSTRDYTGISFEETAKWLEFNFTQEMTWDNHGMVWDIDHVIPVSRWNLYEDDDIAACFSWMNLSPLDSTINRVDKRDKIDHTQIQNHIKQLKNYYTLNKLDEDNLSTYLYYYNNKLISIGETPQLRETP